MKAVRYHSYGDSDVLVYEEADRPAAGAGQVVLKVADASQTVNVTENTAEVHTTDTQIGQTIESKQVVDIPGVLRSEVEDDYHCMGVTLHHDREACTRIEAVDSNNAPTTIASKSFPRFSIFASLLFLLTCFLS